MGAGDGVAERVEAGLARRVGAVERLVPAMRGPAGKVDEDAAALGAKMVHGEAGELRRRDEVDLQGPPPRGAPGGGVFRPGLRLVHRRVVDQHVDPALPGARLPPERPRRVFRREIGADRAASLRRFPRQRLGRGAMRVVMRDDRGAGLQQRADAARADSPRAAGDQNDLAVHIRHARFSRLSVPAPRREGRSGYDPLLSPTLSSSTIALAKSIFRR